MNKLKFRLKYLLIIIIFLISLFFIKHVDLAQDVNYIYVDPGMILSDIVDQLDYFNQVDFYDHKDQQLDDLNSLAKTGLNLSCSDQNNNSYQYKLVVKGDVNGDGMVDHSDIYLIKSSIVGLSKLENEFLLACDHDSNKSLSLCDLFYTNQSIQKSTDSDSEEENNIEVSEIQLNTDSLNLNIGESSVLTYTITPENTTDPDIYFTSTNPEVASVNEQGVVTALKNGYTQIMVTCVGSASAMCDVTVHTIPEELTLDKSELDLFINGTSSYSLQPKFTPSSADVLKDLSWSSSDSDIVSVDENGTLTAKKNGTAKITAVSENNLEASCEVTVYTLPSELTLPSNITLEKGGTAKINAIISPEEANYGTDLSWYTANKNIINLSQEEDSNNCIVTAIENGIATLQARTQNGIMATCTISVFTEIKDFTLSADSATIDLSNDLHTYQLYANSDTGMDLTNSLSWESDDPDIATVDEFGKITAIANGTATITATLRDDLKKNFTLTVQTSPKSITLDETIASLKVGDSKQLTYTITPDDTNINNSVTWSSSNSNIVSVTNGELSAVRTGKAIITAQCENGIASTCIVTVTKDPNKISFNQSQVLLQKSSTTDLLLTFDTSLGDIDSDSLSIEIEDDQVLSYTTSEHGDNQIQLSITGTAVGSSTITAKINDISATCQVIVYSELSSLKLYTQNSLIDNSSVHKDLSIDSSIFTVRAKINEENYDITRIVTWNSTNSDVASIDNNGSIQIKTTGSTTISAQLNGDLSSSFELTVDQSPKSISLKNTTMNLYVNGNDTFSMVPTITPPNCTKQTTISYSSSADRVAKVDSSTGLVTALSSGSAIITATTENGKSATCTVVVRTLPSGIGFYNPIKYLRKGGSATLIALIPGDADTQNTVSSWSSSAPNVISVDRFGNLTALNPGKATITAKTANNKSATTDIIVPNLSMKISNNALDLSIPTAKTATITNIGNANVGTLTYKSSNASVASVDANGKVTALANGNTNIIVTESNANTQLSIPVSVKTTTQSVTLNSTAVSLDIAHTSYQLSATQSPSSISSKGITWSSSNQKVATVKNGLVTRVGKGTAIITATATDNTSKKVTCTVTVKEEKMLIVGASTVVQLAGRRICGSTKPKPYIGINYYSTYGYTVRSTDSWDENYYSSFKSHTGLDDTTADLFFVCKGGTGYYWLAGKKPTDDYDGSGPAAEGRSEIDRIIKANANCHFTVAIMHGGNDLTKPNTKEKVNNIAKTYANYYQSLANAYPSHSFYIFPATPVDESNTTGYKTETGYKSTFSSHTKRYRFACELNSLINNKGNLKYANGFYNDLKALEEKGTYVCYDGNHFSKNTAQLVLDKIMDMCGVLNSSGKKK